MSTTEGIEGFSILLPSSKFHSRCRICGATIRVGEPCYWRKTEEGGVACVACVKGETPVDRAVPAGPQGEWYKLVRFLRDSIVVGSAADLMSPEQITGVQISAFQQSLGDADATQSVIAGNGAELARKRLKRRDDSPLSMGWPVLTFTNQVGEKRCAPIFVATITVELASGEQVVMSRESSFAVNPALLASDGIGQAIAEKIEILGDDVSLSVAREVVDQISSEFHLPLEGFDIESGIELGENLSEGIFNTATLFAGDSGATTNLLRELEELMDRNDWMGTAAASLVTSLSRNMPPSKQLLPPIAPLPLNHSQEQILEAADRCNVTVVTGPPGTGKSQVVVDLVTNAWAHRESILVTSTNNAAVDVAVSRSSSLAPGLLLRTGNKAAREQLPELMASVVNASRTYTTAEVGQTESNVIRAHRNRTAFYAALEELAELENRHTSEVESEEIQSIALKSFGSVELDDSQLHVALNRAKRVEKARYFRAFRWKRLARRMGLPQATEAIGPALRWLQTRSGNNERESRITELSAIVTNQSEQAAIFDAEWHSACADMAKVVTSDAVNRNRAKFSSVGLSQSSHYGTLKAIEPTLGTLRGWACTTLSLKQNFPLTAGLFDQVVVDEASQCHLAYVLPAAYRAKRLVLVGDPNQLPPITRLTSEQETAIAFRNEVSPGDLTRRRISGVMYSAFDFFANVVGDENVKLLNEHYRSHPHIARWFNQTFYGSDLRVLTDISNVPTGTRALGWIDVAGSAHQPPRGSWVNESEAARAVQLVEEYVASGKSVGVVTPFSAQASLIDRLVTQRISRELAGSADFRCGTAHAFQGDERDVVIFSPVVAEGISPRVAKWVQAERRLINVAVSRARETLIVVGNSNVDLFDCPTLSSLRNFAQVVYEDPDDRIGPRIDSESERRLYEALLDRGLNPISKFNVEGYELDFGFFVKDLKLDLEVDGDQHYELIQGTHLRLRRQDITRDGVLKRAGWTVIRVPAWKCFTHPDDVVDSIVEIYSELSSS